MKHSVDQWQAYFEYLDALRLSGTTNMFGAGSYVARQFNLSARESNDILKTWRDTFTDEEDARTRAAKLF